MKNIRRIRKTHLGKSREKEVKLWFLMGETNAQKLFKDKISHYLLINKLYIHEYL
jgi:hypothetical protein